MKRRKKAVIPIVIGILAATVGILLLLNYKIGCIRRELTALEVQTKASTAFTLGVDRAMEEYEINYEDIVNFTFDSQGNIKSVQTNVIKLSSLGNTIGTLIDNEINSMGTYKVGVPLGTLIDSQLVGGGPDVPVYMTMRGITGTQFTDEFESVGINQTRHKIMLEVNVDTYVFCNGRVEVVGYEASVCIAESIIVGVTPQTFANITDS